MGGTYGVTLSDLNNFMKTYPTGRIVPDQYIFNDIYDALKESITSEIFEGLYLESLIQTSREFTGRAHGSQVALPYAGKPAFAKMFTPLRRIMAIAGVDKESMDRARGDGAWGNIVQREIDAMFQDFAVLQELSAIGHGDGALARANGAGVQSDAAGGADDDAGVYVLITCDNTYRDFGLWENTQLIRKGMRLEIYLADGTTNETATTETALAGADAAHVGSVLVTAVTPGYRTAAGSWASTTGTVLVKCCSVASAHTLAGAIDDGAILHVYGCKSNSLSLPMGLSGLVQNASVGTYIDGLDSSRHVEPWVADATYGVTSFLRASYDQLNSMVLDAADFGAASDSPSAGTPCYWALSVIRNAINDRENATGLKVNKLIMPLELAECIDRMNVRENNITVTVGSASGTSQTATAGQAARKFQKSDGTLIDIVVGRNMSKHTIVGLATEPFHWGVLNGGFDYFRLYGTEWQPVMGQRIDSFEAPYGGYSQLSADRVDGCFVINDLRYDI